MKKRKKVMGAILIAMLSGAVLFTSVFAHGGYDGRGFGQFNKRGHSLYGIFFESLHDLDLTDEQENRVEEIWEESDVNFPKGKRHRKEFSGENRAVFKQYAEKLNTLIMKDSLSSEELDAFLTDAYHTMEEKMSPMKNGANSLIIEIHQMLTEEQRAKLSEEMKDEISEIGEEGFFKGFWKKRKTNGRIEKIAEKMELNESQQKMIEELANSIEKNREAIQLKQKDLLGEFANAFSTEELTEEMIDEKNNALHQAVFETLQKESGRVIKFHASLEQSQKQKMVDHFAKFQNKRHRK